MTWDEQLSDYILIGIVSNGAPSCFQGYPSVFTEVAAYTNWIENTMEYHDSFDVENEDSYLFYPYFKTDNLLYQEPQIEEIPSSRIPRKIISNSFSFDTLLSRPQFGTTTSNRNPRNLFSRFLSLLNNQ